MRRQTRRRTRRIAPQQRRASRLRYSMNVDVWRGGPSRLIIVTISHRHWTLAGSDPVLPVLQGLQHERIVKRSSGRYRLVELEFTGSGDQQRKVKLSKSCARSRIDALAAEPLYHICVSSHLRSHSNCANHTILSLHTVRAQVKEISNLVTQQLGLPERWLLSVPCKVRHDRVHKGHPESCLQLDLPCPCSLRPAPVRFRRLSFGLHDAAFTMMHSGLVLCCSTKKLWLARQTHHDRLHRCCRRCTCTSPAAGRTPSRSWASRLRSASAEPTVRWCQILRRCLDPSPTLPPGWAAPRSQAALRSAARQRVSGQTAQQRPARRRARRESARRRPPTWQPAMPPRPLEPGRRTQQRRWSRHQPQQPHQPPRAAMRSGGCPVRATQSDTSPALSRHR